MKRIIITERQVHKVFHINEGKQSDQAKKRTYNILKNGNSWLSHCIDEPSPESDANGLTNFEYEYQNLKSHWCRNNVKFTPVIANILYNQLNYRGTNELVEKVNTFNDIVQLINNTPKYSSMSWDEAVKLSYDDWYNTFKETLENTNKLERFKIDNSKYTNSDYVIKKVTFEESQYYGNKSGGRNGSDGHKICYTQSLSTWDGYTNNGNNTVYICLKNGWENVQPTPQENAPFDDYGLSMIFVIVSPKGELMTSNVRWNHGFLENYNKANNTNKSVDKILSKYEISQITQCNFYETFKGAGQISFNELIEKVKTCEYMADISLYLDCYIPVPLMSNKQYYIIEFENKYNLFNFNTREFVFPKWVDKIKTLRHGIVSIEENGDFNLFNVDKEQFINNYPFNHNFDYVLTNYNYAVCTDSNNKWQLINVTNEDVIVDNCDEIIDYVDKILVLEDNKYRFIDTDGNNINGNNEYTRILLLSDDRYEIGVNEYEEETLLARGKQITEKFFDKIIRERNKITWYYPQTYEYGYTNTKYCYVEDKGLKKALFDNGEISPLWFSVVCGIEKHNDYENKANQIINWLLKESDNDFYGIYEYYKKRDGSYLQRYAEEFIEEKIPLPNFENDEEENEYYYYTLPKQVEDYTIALTYAIIMCGDYLFAGYEDEYEDEQQ